jgi:hypothetical protein
MPIATQPRLLRLVERGSSRVGVSVLDQKDELARLAELAASGDSRAIRTFVMTIGPHVLRVVRRVLGPHHPDVDDRCKRRCSP